jgi:hypothetical protein
MTMKSNGSPLLRALEHVDITAVLPWTSNQTAFFQMPDGSRVTMTYNANNRRVARE